MKNEDWIAEAITDTYKSGPNDSFVPARSKQKFARPRKNSSLQKKNSSQINS
jgi:hypothetical protein